MLDKVDGHRVATDLAIKVLAQLVGRRAALALQHPHGRVEEAGDPTHDLLGMARLVRVHNVAQQVASL